MSSLRPCVDPGVDTATHAAAERAADAIIDDFGRHRRDAYFARFAPEATFLFHATEHRLESRAEYEALWKDWEEKESFRVHSAVSSNRRLQLFGTVAVFSHDVVTVLHSAGVTQTLHERETIILEHRGDSWLGVHEHLSVRSA